MLLIFFNDTATTEIYTLSLHDALPILWVDDQHVYRTVVRCRYRAGSVAHSGVYGVHRRGQHSSPGGCRAYGARTDRKSTRLNSSHANISYAVFCLKKKRPVGVHPQQAY